MKEDKISSKVLNIILKSELKRHFEKEHMCFANAMFISCGLDAFVVKDGNGHFKYLSDEKMTQDYLAPILNELLKNCDAFFYNHDPKIKDVDGDHITFFPPSTFDDKQMIDHYEQFLVSGEENDDKVALANPMLKDFSKEERLKYMQMLRRIEHKHLDRLKNGYKGDYPLINNLISRLYCTTNNTLNPDTEDILGLRDGLSITPVPFMNYAQFWSYIETLFVLSVWPGTGKIYKVSDVLTKDFISQEDLALPTDALKYLPYRCFAIDVSDNREFSGYFDCVLVLIVSYKGNYKAIYKPFDSKGLLADTGIGMFKTFLDGTDTSLDDMELKAKYSKLKIESFDIQKKTTAIFATADTKVFGIDGKYSPFAVKDWKDESLEYFRDFKSVPASAYKKLERLLLATLFYLCCSNKSVRKNASELASKDSFPKEKTDAAGHVKAEIETLGADIEEQLVVSFNNIDLNSMGEYLEKESTSGTGKKGSAHKPHLVRGHFHHYRCGKGRKEVIYKYTAPYYTGVKKNIVSVTTLR